MRRARTPAQPGTAVSQDASPRQPTCRLARAHMACGISCEHSSQGARRRAISEGNTSTLGPAHAEPLVPTKALGPPASPAAAAISALRLVGRTTSMSGNNEQKSENRGKKRKSTKRCGLDRLNLIYAKRAVARPINGLIRYPRLDQSADECQTVYGGETLTRM